MNSLVILLVSTIMVVLLVSSSSYAQNPQESISDVYIFVQTFVRDSDGNLVTYLESDKFTHKNLEALNVFLDFEASQGNDPIYEIKGKKFQLIQRSSVLQIDSFKLVTSLELIDLENPIATDFVARHAHSGYFLTPGDELTEVWTFFRSVD